MSKPTRTGAPGTPRTADLLLDALALHLTEDAQTAAPAMRRALAVFVSKDISVAEELRWLLLAYIVAVGLWDDTACRELTDRYVRLARVTGALALLPMALSTSVFVHVFGGELAEAASLHEEVRTIATATGIQLSYGGALAVAAWQGRQAEAEQLAYAISSQSMSRAREPA